MREKLMKKKRNIFDALIICCAILLVFSWINSADAQEPSPPAKSNVDLDALIKEAVKNNPDLQAARYSWQASIETLPQASALPDPMISYTYFPQPIETRLGPNDHRFMISQKVPYLKKLALKEEIAGIDVKAESLKYQREARRVITRVSESYFELLYIQKALELTRQNQQVLEELAKIGAADYATDSTTLNDVLTAQSQLAQLSYDFILLLELKETESARLNSILNRPLDTKIGKLIELSVSLPYKLDELYEIASKSREEFKIIDAKIEKLDRAERLAKLASYPDFRFELMYSMIGTPEGMQVDDPGRDSYGVTIGATIPLWSSKNESMVQEKALKKRAMRQIKNARVNQTNAMINNLYFRMMNAERLTKLYSKTLLPQAKATMEKAEEWYKQKLGSYAQLLETQAVWFSMNLAYQRATADYNKYAIKLQDTLGIAVFAKGDRDE